MQFVPVGFNHFSKGHTEPQLQRLMYDPRREVIMTDKSVATQGGILIALSLIIAGVLEAVARISNLLNQPINPVLLAAGAITAAIIWVRRT